MNKKSIWAVVAGALAIVGVTTVVDVALFLVGVYPANGEPLDHSTSAIATSYRVVIGIGGAWLTALLAPDKPMKHAMILGCIGTALGAVGLIATWNQDLGPKWYPVAHVVLAIPEVWIGAKLHVMRSRLSTKDLGPSSV